MKFKIYMVAAALAATASTNAIASITLHDAVDDTVTLASELITAADEDGNGRLAVANAGSLLDVIVDTGFTIAGNTSKYARFDLTNAVFGANVTSLTDGVVSQDGDDQDNTVIFEVSDTTDILATDDLTLIVSSYDVSPTAASSITYVLYETAADAVNQTNPLATYSEDLTVQAAGSSGDFTESHSPISTVASGFTLWDATDANVGDNTVEETLGQTDPADILSGGNSYTLAGAVTTVASFITAAQDITLTGDVSVGAFTVESDNNCDGVDGGASGDEVTALTANAAGTEATGTIIDAQVALFVCADLTGVAAAADVIAKGAYTLTLVTDAITNTIGSVVYDTTTVEIPYITTFSGYNQRIFIENRGGTDAFYTTSFGTEDGVTAAGGTGATGTVISGEITVIKASDMVTFTGGSRGSATIEIEAQGADIQATTQIVDLDFGNTDTLVLQ